MVTYYQFLTQGTLLLKLSQSEAIYKHYLLNMVPISVGTGHTLETFHHAEVHACPVHICTDIKIQLQIANRPWNIQNLDRICNIRSHLGSLYSTSFHASGTLQEILIQTLA